MKKIIAVLAAASVFSSTAFALNGVAVDIKVNVNGSEIVFEDQQPIILNDRTMLPIRAVMEAMGKEVSWDGVENRAIVTDGAITLKLGIGDNIMIKETSSDGLAVTEYIELDSAAVNINDRTLLPVRAVAEAFGASVGWNGETSTVIING